MREKDRERKRERKREREREREKERERERERDNKKINKENRIIKKKERMKLNLQNIEKRNKVEPNISPDILVD